MSFDESSRLPPDVAVAVVIGSSGPGTPVPGLDDLVICTGLPAIEVVAGIDVLMERGAIELVPGTQRLVSRRVPYRVDGSVPLSLTDGVRGSGTLRPGVRWRSLVRLVEEMPADPDLAHALEVPVGGAVLRVVRDRLIGEEVVGHSESWLRADVGIGEFVDALFEHGSLASVLANRHGGRLQRLSFDASLAVPPADVGARFGRAAGEHAWWMESLNSMGAGVPVELSRGWLRADHFRLIID